MFRIEKIKLNELSEFVNSARFALLSDKPISSLRAKSYVKNPVATSEDVVLYMAFDKEKIVGYRTIWRDTYSCTEDKSFGWLSGNWVHNDYRRQGVSTLLFNEVNKDWNGELMYTNYAVNSKLLYDKTGFFKEIKSLEGTRFYTRFCLGDVLVNKHKLFFYSKNSLILLDRIANFLLDLLLSFSSKNQSVLKIKKDEVWSDEVSLFLKEFKQKELFKREVNRYRWVKEYPWIKEEDIKNESLNYYFSLVAKEFKNNYYTFYTAENILTAFIWLSIKNGHLKIPYAYFNKESVNEVVDFIILKCKNRKVKTVLVYNKEIEVLLVKKMTYLSKKTFYQNYFATQKIVASPGFKMKGIQSGDGDVVFT